MPDDIWNLHPLAPRSPLFSVEETQKAYDLVFSFRKSLILPQGVTALDIQQANGIYPQASDKKLDAVEKTIQYYAKYSKRTTITLEEFRQRRLLSNGMFDVSDGMTKVGGQVRVGAVLRVDELLTVFTTMLEDLQAASATPEGANDPELQAALNLLLTAANETVIKQQQGKADSQKAQDKELQMETRVANLEVENARLRAALGPAAQVLIDGQPATTVAHPPQAKGHKAPGTGTKTPGTITKTPPSSPSRNGRKSPR